jgi:hypothetical protein
MSKKSTENGVIHALSTLNPWVLGPVSVGILVVIALVAKGGFSVKTGGTEVRTANQAKKTENSSSASGVVVNTAGAKVAGNISIFADGAAILATDVQAGSMEINNSTQNGNDSKPK